MYSNIINLTIMYSNIINLTIMYSNIINLTIMYSNIINLTIFSIMNILNKNDFLNKKISSFFH